MNLRRLDEFSIIRKYFAPQSINREDVLLGIGDDGAVLAPPAGKNLVYTTDMLLDGVHFPEKTDPFAVGYKSLAVNLSDLAAMGAEPAWATLTLSLPVYNPDWIAAFCAGFDELATEYSVQLVGGDLACGPLAVAVHLTGFTDPSNQLYRSGAKVGDGMFVSGSLGDAGLGLKVVQGKAKLNAADQKHALQRLQFPHPRIALGQALSSFGSAAIDVSDGIVADAGHISNASNVAIHLDLHKLPVGQAVANHTQVPDWDMVLCAGDDYELCFTVAKEKWHQLSEIEQRLRLPLTKIGTIEAGAGVHVFKNGQEYCPRKPGYRHFV